MKGSVQISKESGLSISRVKQFALEHKLPKIGNSYIWDKKAEKLFYERIGQRGNKKATS